MDLVITWIRKSGLRALLISLACVIGAGLLISTVSVVWTMAEGMLWRRPFCLSSDCVDSAKHLFAGSVDILKLFSAVVTWVATVGGIVLALLNYLNSTSATAFGNHVAHSKIFYDYLTAEIAKRERLKPANVDIYRLYALAFEGSRLGLMQVSDRYRLKIKAVAHVINDSNNLMMSASAEGFRFKDHQHRLILALADLGVTVTTQPRIDFFEIEEEVFGLLDAINHVFCSESPIDRLPQRNYR